ncbi:MAG: NeuD/PglB/VioB family sugar acetyltransferase [Cytophagales bacterium]|nr:NeuD/PglB/VioB family sugar acetyltransferase [Cytophagales bacterium]
MKNLVILGGSGIGMIAASVAHDLGNYKVKGFLNDVVEVGSSIGKYNKIPVIGRTDDLESLLKEDNTEIFIAYVGLSKEKETFEKIESLKIPADRYANLIHPTAIIPRGFCHIGNGVMMSPLSQLSPDTTLEDNCILLPNSFVGHDSTLERFAHVATNGVIGANVRVGKAVHIGSNATIREKVNIGDYSLIGAGAVVLQDVDSNSVVVGNPARVIQERK